MSFVSNYFAVAPYLRWALVLSITLAVVPVSFSIALPWHKDVGRAIWPWGLVGVLLPFQSGLMIAATASRVGEVKYVVLYIVLLIAIVAVAIAVAAALFFLVLAGFDELVNAWIMLDDHPRKIRNAKTSDHRGPLPSGPKATLEPLRE